MNAGQSQSKESVVNMAQAGTWHGRIAQILEQENESRQKLSRKEENHIQKPLLSGKVWLNFKYVRLQIV